MQVYDGPCRNGRLHGKPPIYGDFGPRDVSLKPAEGNIAAT